MRIYLFYSRRFGKSLFLDTLKELFEGNEPLFKGLAAEQQWDWSVKYPVLRFSFGSEKFRDTEGLPNTLDAQLTRLEEVFSIKKRFDHVGGRFSDLIINIHQNRP